MARPEGRHRSRTAHDVGRLRRLRSLPRAPSSGEGLARARPSGLFQLIPADRGREGIGDTNPLSTGALLVAPYFYSFATACTHHGLTEQVFAEVYLACQATRRPVTIRGTRYVFAHVPERHFFGFAKADVLGSSVLMATPERALLDALDRPRFAGGIREVARIVANAAKRVSWEKVLDLATRWDESAIVQRLGYLLDLHRIDLPPHVREALHALVAPANKLHLGPRVDWGTGGRLVRPWGIIENVPRERLLEPGRRVKPFPKRSP
ncbi:MAG: type IV toxin-antitoxin system AbiEi family antitoxin domain-containing protein [Polyangiaceae bacterium]